jgi:prolipoprotein diacylglyceryl transferase
VLVHGSTPLRAYGLLIALALVLGFLWFRARWRRRGGSEREAALCLAWTLPGLLVGARLAHCLLYDLERTLADPLFVLAVQRGGLASHGALVGAALALVIASRRHRLDGVQLADALAAPAALGVVLVRVGNFLNSEIVGRVTSAGLGVRFLRHDGPLAPPRHPVQLYEAALGLAVVALILSLERARKTPRAGEPAAIFLALYFGGRILVERFKQPEGIVPAGAPLTTGALLSLLPALLGLLLWLWPRRAGRRGGCALPK